MTPQTRGIPFGNPHFDPLYEAASRNGLPVATHLMGQTPFELIPHYPVGNPRTGTISSRRGRCCTCRT